MHVAYAPGKLNNCIFFLYSWYFPKKRCQNRNIKDKVIKVSALRKYSRSLLRKLKTSFKSTPQNKNVTVQLSWLFPFLFYSLKKKDKKLNQCIRMCHSWCAGEHDYKGRTQTSMSEGWSLILTKLKTQLKVRQAGVKTRKDIEFRQTNPKTQNKVQNKQTSNNRSQVNQMKQKSVTSEW